MTRLDAGDASLHFQVKGDGDTMVLVHGSLDELRVWDQVAPGLSGSFRVVTYDRRGHGDSTAPARQGSVHEDLADLAALIREVGAPAHVVANSFGAVIALGLAARQPDMFRTLCVHEPPLLGLLRGSAETRPTLDHFQSVTNRVAELISSGRHQDGARTFVEEVAAGPGVWDSIPGADREMMTRNAPTFLDELRDPDAFSIDVSGLRTFPHPLLMTGGDRSIPMFSAILGQLVRTLPRAEYATIPGAGHVPHETAPRKYQELVESFARRR